MRRISAATLALVVGMIGLGHTAGAASPQIAGVQTAADPAADQVAEAVSKAQPGQSVSVTDPANGSQAQLQVLRSYRAASGRECRVYSLNGAEALHLACSGSAGWFNAPPLALANTPGGAGGYP